MMPGLSERITSAGIPVLRIHYAADRKKRPGTPDGDAWLAEATQGYPGGTRSPRWRKEYEIDYGAMGGTMLFPEWETWQLNGRIVIPPFPAVGYRFYGSYDHGWLNPSAYHVHGIDSDGRIITLWEFYAHHVPVHYIRKIIVGASVRLPDGREFLGNPYAGQETWRVADPSIWNEDNAQNDGPNRATEELFRRREPDGTPPVVFIKGERGGDLTVVEWLQGYYWRDPMDPLYRITTACPKLIWELGRQRHKQISEKVAVNRDQPEALVDKDNHGWDGLKMFLKKFPPSAMAAQQAQKPGTFTWWQQVAKDVQAGKPLPSYHRDMVS